MKKFAIALIAVAVLASSTWAGPLLGRPHLLLVPSQAQLSDEPIAESQEPEVVVQPTTKRAFFRTLLRDRIDRERRGERKRLLRRILADDDLQTIAIDYADYLQSLEPTQASEEGDADGKFFRFFQWIIENQDAIIAFLEKIIALFGDISPESVSFEPAGDGGLLAYCRLPASHDTRPGVFALGVGRNTITL